MRSHKEAVMSKITPASHGDCEACLHEAAREEPCLQPVL